MITEPLLCPQGLTVPELRKLLETWPDNDAETGEPNEVWFMTGDCLSSPVTCVERLNRSDIVFSNESITDETLKHRQSGATLAALQFGGG